MRPVAMLPGVLLVEGKNDLHVISTLCESQSLDQTFTIEYSDEYSESSGFEYVLEDIPIRLKRPSIQALGIVVDADEEINSHWLAVRNRLQQAGYSDLSQVPDRNGYVSNRSNMPPRVGVWIMPDNTVNGMLEDFVIRLIPPEDTLRDLIEEHLNRVESRELNRYNRSLHRSKAFIHSWLACQETPGRPMGQAVTCKYLSPEQPLALAFVDWLKRLFY
jgi:hypothetical protein